MKKRGGRCVSRVEGARTHEYVLQGGVGKCVLRAGCARASCTRGRCA